MGYGFWDVTNYVLFTNPVSHGTITALSGLARSTGIANNGNNNATQMVVREMVWPKLHKLAGSSLMFTRLGGLSGAAAMWLMVYQSHCVDFIVEDYYDPKIDMKRVFETTNRYHLIHSLALMAVPLVRHPLFTGSMMLFGTGLVCGTGYYYAFSGRRNLHTKLTAAIGNSCLCIAWLSMVL